jgi:hypothetical protein
LQKNGMGAFSPFFFRLPIDVTAAIWGLSSGVPAHIP